MKLPVYCRSGVYYLHTRINRKQIKISLKTRDRDVAMLRALAIYQNLLMSKAPPSIDEVLQNFENNGKTLEIGSIELPSGVVLNNVSVDPNNPNDIKNLQALIANAGVGDDDIEEISQVYAARNRAKSSDKTTAQSLTLFELLDRYKLLNKSRSAATFKSYQTHVTEFSDFVKNREIHRIGEGDVTLFIEKLAATKQTPRTIDNKISTLRALFNFGIKHKYFLGENPAANRQFISGKDKIKSSYAIYELDEIKTLFKLESLKNAKKAHEFWCPVLALLTGARVGEITSLRASDIKSSNGIFYLKINDSKTVAGIREVPLHPYLFELGFGEFISGKDKLFPYLTEIEGRGNASRVSKFWKRYTEKNGVTRPKLVFHSLRKFFNEYLMKAEIQIEPRCQLLGHEIENVNVSIYSNKFTVEKLAELIFPVMDKMIEEVFK